MVVPPTGGGGGGGGGGGPTVLPGGYTMTFYRSSGANASGEVISTPMTDGMTMNQNITSYPYGSVTPSGGTWQYILWRPADDGLMDGGNPISANYELNPAGQLGPGAWELWIGDEAMFASWYDYWESNGTIPTSPAPYITMTWNTTAGGL